MNWWFGRKGAPIANPGAGATTDVQARETIGAILSALRQHGLIAP